MSTKVPVRKGVNLVLTISLIGVGSSLYIPSAYAADNGTPPAQIVQNTSANTLSRLEMDGVQLNQAFSPELSQYSATVENSIDKINLLLETNDHQTTISVNGQPVVNGGSTSFQLQTGENAFIITVDDGKNTPNTYSLTITRKENSNNLLKSLTLSKGDLSPAFNPATTAYNVHVTNDVDSLFITADPAEKTSLVTVNKQLESDKRISVPISVGKSEITILVTAENGDQKTYTLEVFRDIKKPSTFPTNSKGGTNPPTFSKTTKGTGRTQGSKGNLGIVNWTGMKQGVATPQNGSSVQKVSKATLSKLSVSNGTWNKAFSKDAFTYHIAESADVNTVTISSNSSYKGATISIQGGTSNIVQLGENKKTIIPIVVIDGSDRKTYVLVFDKNIKQTDVAVSTSENITTSDAITNTDTSNSPVSVNNWTGRMNTQPTSWWGRLIQSIRSFFN